MNILTKNNILRNFLVCRKCSAFSNILENRWCSMGYDEMYSEIVSQDRDWLIDKERIRAIIKLELKPIAADRILEIGRNKGEFVKYFQQFAPETYGIDINKSAVRNKVTEKIFLMGATKMGFKDGFFNKIYSSHTIEHISESSKLFSEINRLLKPNGRVVLIYPFELFRGMAALRTAWQSTGSIFKAKKLHVHTYCPKKIKRLINDKDMVHIYSKLFFARTPQWLTVLEKKNA